MLHDIVCGFTSTYVSQDILTIKLQFPCNDEDDSGQFNPNKLIIVNTSLSEGCGNKLLTRVPFVISVAYRWNLSTN